jgi:hypothetical protein
MTKIAISSNPSGTGTATLSAPNTNSNINFELPGASGTLLTSGDFASQQESETGTDNTKLMTPLRTAQSIAVNVLPTIASAAYSGVGTYILATRNNDSTNTLPDATVAGSNLTPYGVFSSGNNGSAFTGIDGTVTLTGTWRAMGRATGDRSHRGTLFLRIS